MAIFYVSPTGSDGQAGTFERPFASLQHAHDLARPGDTIYLRGGVYELTSGIQLTNDGASGRPITVANYPGEKPVLDGSRMTSDEYPGRSGAGGYVLDGSSISWNHIVGLEVRGGPIGGVILRDESHNNIVERLDVHGSGRLSEWDGKGISLYGPASNNLLLNNDSHDNRDLSGDNADGFQISTTGAGNVLRGNRAWNNSDDGFDFFNVHGGTRGAAVLIEGNWAFRNGYDASGRPEGDGNGFKLGGMRGGTDSDSGGHTVLNNVSWSNLSNGFDQNDANIDMALHNNTAYNNGQYNYGFWNGENSFLNNVSAGAGKVATSGSGSSNSWNLPSAPTSSDFSSFNDATARGARAADGALPSTDFLHLSAGSKLIDKGVDTGRSYTGSAPDLGSFERGMTPAPAPSPTMPSPTVPSPTVPAPEPAPAPRPAPAPQPAPTTEASKTSGTDKADVITGTSGNDWIHGNAGADTIDGGAGKDTLLGGSENDVLIGGPGADTMAGGAGRDTFVFRSPSESVPGAGNRDVIQWFGRGDDKIDLSIIDANTAVAGNQVLQFAGKTTAVEPNSVSFFNSGKATIVQGDVDGDENADFQIELNERISFGRDQVIL